MARKIFLFALVVFLAGAVAFAADMSGTYTRDKEKSDPMMGGRGGGGGGGGGTPPNVEVTLTVKQGANEIAITQTTVREGGDPRTQESKYTLDGKESKFSTGRGETVAKAKMDGEKILIQGVRKFGEMEMNFKEEYSLSADGKVLTVTSTMSTPNGERTAKQVYNKK